MNSTFPYKQDTMENENKEALKNGFYIMYIHQKHQPVVLLVGEITPVERQLIGMTGSNRRPSQRFIRDALN